MSLDKFQLNQDIVVITGGSGMLGLEYCKAIKEIGGIPISLDLKCPPKGTCYHILCDITQEHQINESLEEIHEVFQRPVYGLINNTALDPKMQKDSQDTRHLRLDTYPSDYFKKEWETCVLSALLCTKHFGNEMIHNKRGVIINISSKLGIVAPNINFYDSINVIKPIGYTIVKHALIGMTKHIAVEWAKYGIRCNCLCPDGVFNNHSKEFVCKLSNLIPLGKMADKDSYNSAIQFLLTDASSYMTGQTLIMDGGRTAW